jgi:hypothetical protein
LELVPTTTTQEPTMQTVADPTSYDRAIARIEALVAGLNTLLGYSTELDADARRTCVTFGYIGNVDVNGANDNRSWSVFLPHPGRVGTDDDRIGSFRTDDDAGAWAAVRELAAFSKGARFARR